MQKILSFILVLLIGVSIISLYFNIKLQQNIKKLPNSPSHKHLASDIYVSVENKKPCPNRPNILCPPEIFITLQEYIDLLGYKMDKITTKKETTEAKMILVK